MLFFNGTHFLSLKLASYQVNIYHESPSQKDTRDLTIRDML